MIFGILAFWLMTAGNGIDPAPEDSAAIKNCQCPATVTVREETNAPKGWFVIGGRAERQFERLSIYNGKRGGPEFELAPSNEAKIGKNVTQTWNLTNYRDMNIFIRCRYRDSEVVLETDVPSSFAACTFRFEVDARGKILGKPQMSCR